MMRRVNQKRDIKRSDKGVSAIAGRSFKFRLDPVLDIRQQKLERIQASFARQQQAVMKVKNLLAETQAEIQRLMIPIHNDSVDPVLAQQSFYYIQHLKRQVTLITNKLRHEEALLAHVREELRLAHVSKKSLDKLKEKQRDAFNREQALQEEKQLEDIVIMRQARR